MKATIFAEDHYEIYAKALAHSLFRNEFKFETIFFLKDKGTLFSKSLKERGFRVEKIPPLHPLLKKAPLGKVGHPSVWSRMWLWEPGFIEGDIFHLDADTLVLCPFDKPDFFAVNDFQDDHIQAASMLNAGVFFLSQSKKNGLEEMAEFAVKNPSLLPFADQSLISLFARRNHFDISNDVSYNFQTRFYQLALEAKYEDLKVPDQIKILHFSGKKPDELLFQHWVLSRIVTDELTALWEMYLTENYREDIEKKFSPWRFKTF